MSDEQPSVYAKLKSILAHLGADEPDAKPEILKAALEVVMFTVGELETAYFETKSEATHAKRHEQNALIFRHIADNFRDEADELESDLALSEATLAEKFGKTTPPPKRTLRSIEGVDKAQLSRVAKAIRQEDADKSESERRITTPQGGTLTEVELWHVLEEIKARRERVRGRINKNQHRASKGSDKASPLP